MDNDIILEEEQEKMTLEDFLSGNTVENITKQVIISNRIPFEFTIKGMTAQERDTYKKMSYVQKNGKKVFSEDKFNKMVIINQTIKPVFNAVDFLTKLSAVTPEDCVNKTLLSGEQDNLIQEIFKLSGFELNINELIEQAKN